ncbi:unnamed protein product [Parascedosporium putredinis]|uniref:JmjC domain-containing protein n=1 Tax=Parascedosporium putredinis TaxID=1442378 RepID=A0A9P1H7I4_9PEZI|nr:unnamed protein product [Parascedosporium putredinis]CAI7998888.1 unnamed protein product [Parascedosporium putredinis]
MRNKELLTVLRHATGRIHTSCSAVPLSESSLEQSGDVGDKAAIILDLHGLDNPVGCEGRGRDADVMSTAFCKEKLRLVRKRLDDLLALAEARFLAFRFEVLPDCWRQLYVDVRVLSFHLGVLRGPAMRTLRKRGAAADDGFRADQEADREVADLVKVLDLAIIVAGGGPGGGRELVNRLLGLLEKTWNGDGGAGGGGHRCDGLDGRRAKRQRRGTICLPSDNGNDDDDEDDEYPGEGRSGSLAGRTRLFRQSGGWLRTPVTRPAERIDGVSMDAFQKYIDPATNPEPVVPVVFTDLMGAWPALADRPWSRPGYLLSQTFGGRRYVPVEIGRSYVDEGWTQKLIPFAEFLATYIDPSLAPHPDAGRRTVEEPPPARHKTTARAWWREKQQQQKEPRAAAAPDPAQNKPKVAAPQLHAWFGPGGTITPLHTDSVHNLLCQVVGRKYVRLYPPAAAEAMMPRGRELLVELNKI